MRNEAKSPTARSGRDLARLEILAILAECGLVPGQGVEGILDRLAGPPIGR